MEENEEDNQCKDGQRVYSFSDPARREEAADAGADQHATDHRGRRINGIPEIEEEALDQDDLHEHVTDAEAAEIEEDAYPASALAAEEMKGEHDRGRGKD